MTNSVAVLKLDREELANQLITILQLGAKTELLLRIAVQGIPENLLRSFQEVLEDIAVSAQPGDEALIKILFEDRAARRDAIRTLFEYARTQAGH